MDSALQSGRNRQIRSLVGFEAEGCDITSLVFHRHNEDGFELTVRGRFVPPTKIDAIPPLELPEPLMGLDEDSIYGDPGGLRASFSTGVLETALGDGRSMASPCQAKGVSAELEPVPNVTIHANFGSNVDFSAQVAKVPLQMVRKQHTENYQTVVRGSQMAPEQQTEIYQTAVHESFLSDFNEQNPNGIFSINEPGQNMDFSERFEAGPDFPTMSQAFSSNNFNCLYDVEASPTIPSASPEMGFSSKEFNFLGSSFSSSASSSSSSVLTATTSPSTSATTTPSIADSSPEGHICRLCHSTFTRPSDLKRHEGVHFPEQRKFHCLQSECERKGRKGFYRRDKLRIHERQAHGLDT